MVRVWVLGLSFLMICGCGHVASGAATAEVRPLTEGRALGVIADFLSERGVSPDTGWRVEIAHEVSLPVDLRLGERFGIEWVSPQDRLDFGDAIPRPEADGRLRMIGGYGDDAGVEILLLEHSTYRYSRDQDAVRRGAPGASDVESRLRRDVRDFLEYLRGQPQR